MKNLVYVVKINYYSFYFDDGSEALKFASAAMNHQVWNEDVNDDYDIEVEIKRVELHKAEPELDDPLPFV